MNGKPSLRIFSNLWDGVPVRDHVDNVVEREEGVTLDLREHVLPHRAARQEPDELDVVPGKKKQVCLFRTADFNAKGFRSRTSRERSRPSDSARNASSR